MRNGCKNSYPQLAGRELRNSEHAFYDSIANNATNDHVVFDSSCVREKKKKIKDVTTNKFCKGIILGFICMRKKRFKFFPTESYFYFIF